MATLKKVLSAVGVVLTLAVAGLALGTGVLFLLQVAPLVLFGLVFTGACVAVPLVAKSSDAVEWVAGYYRGDGTIVIRPDGWRLYDFGAERDTLVIRDGRWDWDD